MTIRAVVHDRRIEVPAPDDLPDGSEVLVEVIPAPGEKIGMDESEWRDDPDAIAEWVSWLETIEPIAFAPDDAFTDAFRRFNLEAVRKQMQEDGE
jgi:hypothetical protein